MKRSLRFVILYVANLDEAVSYYRDVLGFEFFEEKSTRHFKAFDLGGGIILGLESGGTKKASEKLKNENAHLIQLSASSEEELEEITKGLEQKGVRILERSSKKSFGIVTNFLDMDGNKLEFICATE